MEKDSGFTLVELLVTIVVATVLLALGVPAFQSFIKNNRVTAQTNDLVSAIQLARSEALKRGIDAVVCASSDQKSCTGKDTWADGWIVFSDVNRNNAPDAGTDEILRISEGLSAGSTLTTPVGFLCFLPTGMSGTPVPPSASTSCSSENAGAFDFTLKAKDCQKTQARKISVTKEGHTGVTTVKCS